MIVPLDGRAHRTGTRGVVYSAVYCIACIMYSVYKLYSGFFAVYYNSPPVTMSVSCIECITAVSAPFPTFCCIICCIEMLLYTGDGTRRTCVGTTRPRHATAMW